MHRECDHAFKMPHKYMNATATVFSLHRMLDVGVGGVGQMMCVYVGGGVVSNGFIS
jgi:hypothetical protein